MMHFLEMKRSTRRWQQDEERTVRKNWGRNCWEDSFWVWMLVSLDLFLLFTNMRESKGKTADMEDIMY